MDPSCRGRALGTSSTTVNASHSIFLHKVICRSELVSLHCCLCVAFEAVRPLQGLRCAALGSVSRVPIGGQINAYYGSFAVFGAPYNVTRVNRIIVDYLLRRGYIRTAEALVERHGLAVHSPSGGSRG